MALALSPSKIVNHHFAFTYAENGVWSLIEGLYKDAQPPICTFRPPPPYKFVHKLSRRSTFKLKLEEKVGDVIQFFQPLTPENCERQMLLIPIGRGKRLVADDFYDEDVKQMPSFKTDQDSDFQTIVHSALKKRGDFLSWPGQSDLEIPKEASTKVVPDSLHLFLNVLLKGSDVSETIYGDPNDELDSDDKSDNDDSCMKKCRPFVDLF
ncbi:hypothetical protein FQR65_LT11877 [Abscondita terminalis]|nr:hypothetical protein FQR65_LT11877 [Abscondita terminalis]